MFTLTTQQWQMFTIILINKTKCYYAMCSYTVAVKRVLLRTPFWCGNPIGNTGKKIQGIRSINANNFFLFLPSILSFSIKLECCPLRRPRSILLQLQGCIPNHIISNVLLTPSAFSVHVTKINVYFEQTPEARELWLAARSCELIGLNTDYYSSAAWTRSLKAIAVETHFFLSAWPLIHYTAQWLRFCQEQPIVPPAMDQKTK